MKNILLYIRSSLSRVEDGLSNRKLPNMYSHLILYTAKEGKVVTLTRAHNQNGKRGVNI